MYVLVKSHRVNITDEIDERRRKEKIPWTIGWKGKYLEDFQRERWQYPIRSYTLHYGRSTRSCANTSFTPRHVLCKNFFFPARDKGFVISRKYSTQTTRDIIIISNKLNQLPLLRTTILSESILRAAISRNIVSTNRKSLSKRRSAANSSRLDTWKVVMYRRFCIACYVSPQIVAEKFDPLRISLSLSLPLCVRVCVRPSREWKRPRIKFRPRRKVGRACAGRRNCTFASLNNHTSPAASNNRPAREISPDLCARTSLSLSLSRIDSSG